MSEPVVGKRSALGMICLASVLGAVSIGWDCGDAGGFAAAPAPRADASTSRGSSDGAPVGLIGSGTGSSSSSMTLTGHSNLPVDAGAKSDAETISGDALLDGGDAELACIAEGQPCTDAGGHCCGAQTCASGTCGACIPEGTMSSGAKPCCDGLSLSSDNYCGTSACVSDGVACGGSTGTVCCNDDCISGRCGGDAGQ